MKHQKLKENHKKLKENHKKLKHFPKKLKEKLKKLKNPPTRVEMGWQILAKKKPDISLHKYLMFVTQDLTICMFYKVGS